MRVDNHLIWRDACISVFADEDKCCVVFINDKRQSKVLCYDDNFYTFYDSIETYCELLFDSLEKKDEEYQEMVDEFIYDQLVKDGCDIDFEYLKERGVNYNGKKRATD